MRTDDLIAMLSTDVEQVRRGQVARTITVAVAIGGVLAVAAVLISLGARSNLLQWDHLLFLLAKVLFTTAIVALASVFLIRLARPGGERRISLLLLTLPFLALALVASLNLAHTPRSHWNDVVVGDRWLECVLAIPVIAIVPFATLVWAVRRAAPTDLTRAGALVGLVAGALSATGYSLHCTDDALPFIALWYSGTIVLCVIVGARLGPTLLRW